jgi:hypothetical protein
MEGGIAVNRVDAAIFNASARRSRLSIDRFVSPRSTCPIKVRCNPASCAKASCDQPRASLVRRIFAAATPRRNFPRSAMSQMFRKAAFGSTAYT